MNASALQNHDPYGVEQVEEEFEDTRREGGFQNHDPYGVEQISEEAEDTRRDYWMSAEEAIDYGIVSRIVTSTDELR